MRYAALTAVVLGCSLMGACSSGADQSTLAESGSISAKPSAPIVAEKPPPAECLEPAAPQQAQTVPGAEPPEYTITDLGVPITRGWPLRLNNAGQVAGTRNDETGNSEEAFLWDRQSGARDIGDGGSSVVVALNNAGQVAVASWKGGEQRAYWWDPVAGIEALDMPAGYTESQVNAINDKGLVVGAAYPTDEESGEAQAFAWSPTTGTTLSGWGGEALDVNNNGQVLVTNAILREPIEEYPIEEYTYSPNHLFLWSPGTPARDLGLGEAGFGEGDSSRRINESSQVASTLEPMAGGTYCAFLWDPGSNTRTYLGRDTQVLGINDKGQVLGRFAMTYSSFIWDAGSGMTDLGTLDARDLNEQGQVVGSQEGRAVVWDPATGITDLGALHKGDTAEAWAINDRGEIVGWSGRTDRTGEDDPGPDPGGHAVLWTPK